MALLLDRPEWRRATRLAERLATLRARSGAGRPVGLDGERAARELEHWRTLPPFDEGELFARRWAADGIDARELSELLGESSESVQGRESAPPRWLARLARAYGRDPRAPGQELADGQDPDRTLVALFEPLVAQGLEELETRTVALAAAHPEAPFEGRSAAGLFEPALRAGLLRLALRTFALELGIARMQAELAGATPAERFQDFARRLETRAAQLEFLGAYPSLARRAVEHVERWCAASAEFLERLAGDRLVLSRELAGGALGRLVHVHSGAGDTHRGGRSVVLATFDTGLRLVYKPRSLAVEAHFQELVAELNAAGLEPPLARLALLERGTHGWVEFVAAKPCHSRAEVQAFYRRSGAWLALLHALGATDAHLENLVAAGEHPVPIDLETLFHPRAHERELPERGQHLVRRVLHGSVLRVGLLPSRVTGADGAAADLGGLSGAGGQETPDEVTMLEGRGTDELRAVRRRAVLPPAHNLPVLDGAPVPAHEHVAEIVAGFRATWRLLQEQRARLLAPDGPLLKCEKVEVRAVVRATRFYGLLLEESLHPDCMGDALELERLYDRLWVGVQELPHLERVLAAERADLLADDVPLFTTRPGSRDLWDSRGRCIPGFFRESGLELARATLAGMDERELERQEWLIRGALATGSVTAAEPRWPSYAHRPPAQDPARSELEASALRHALAIGARLEAQALRDDAGHAAWMGFAFVGTRWELAALPDDLYAGVPGVALFLAHLARISGEERFAALARAGLKDLCTDVKRFERLGSIGAFNGLGGLIYAFAQLAHLWQDAELLAHAGTCADLAERRLDADEDLDVIGGAAGLLAALESLRALQPSPRWDELSLACAARLRSRAERLHVGAGWRTRIGGPEPATGFSHGAAGIAWALLGHHRRTGDAAALELARAGMRFENTLFDTHAGNWLDPGSRRSGVVDGGSDGTTTTAWCYGAPGIGLARLAALAHDPTGEARRDVERAVAATRATGFGKNHCLCHGALGNLEFLAHAAEALGDENLELETRRSLAALFASLERDGSLCGLPMGVESPALMNGLAGIGLGLLRFARPRRVPSVLTLEPPLR